jgi:hypothetical protein
MRLGLGRRRRLLLIPQSVGIRARRYAEKFPRQRGDSCHASDRRAGVPHPAAINLNTPPGTPGLTEAQLPP